MASAPAVNAEPAVQTVQGTNLAATISVLAAPPALARAPAVDKVVSERSRCLLATHSYVP